MAIALPYTETFTGTTGAAWPALWTNGSGNLDAGAIRDIQGNRGRLQPPNAAWAGGTRAYLDGMAAVADSNVYCEFQSPSPGDIYTQFAVRSDGLALNASDPNNGYLVVFGEGGCWIAKRVAGVNTDLVSSDFPMTANTAYSVRIRTEGTTIQVRAWATASAEPGTWTLSVTDASLVSGKLWLSATNGGTPTSVTFDNLTVSEVGPRQLYTFDEGTNGTSVPLSGDIYQNTGVTYTQAGAIHGSMGITGNGTNSALFITAPSPGAAHSGSIYLTPRVISSGSVRFVVLQDSANAIIGSIRVHSDGKFDIGNQVNARVTTSTLTWAVGTRYRVDWYHDGATTLQAKIFVGANVEGTVPDETISGTIGTGTLHHWFISPSANSNAGMTVELDTLRLYDGNVTPKPYAASAASSFTLWNGTQEIQITFDGIWNGTSIVPGSYGLS